MTTAWLDPSDPHWPPPTDPRWTCPRCGGDIPQPGRRGQYIGAQSRTDRATEVCSPCGDEEAWQQRAGCLVPQSDWPVPPPGSHTPEPPKAGWKDTWEQNRGATRAALAPPPIPREVPNLRLHLLEKWIPGGIFEKNLKLKNNPPEFIKMEADAERLALRQASLWWIRDEMVDLTVAAAKNVPGDLRGQDVEMPDGQDGGLAVLAKPWEGLDAMVPEHRVSVSALAWSINLIDGHRCLTLAAYEYVDFTGGMTPDKLLQAMASGALNDAQVEDLVQSGGTALSGTINSSRLRGGAWIFLGSSNWPLVDRLDGQDGIWDDLPHSGPPWDAGAMHASIVDDRRFFTAFCVLVNHKLSQTEMVWSQRAERKRAERAGVDSKREPSHVRLIKLREVVARRPGESDADHERRKVEWSHRWIVGLPNGRWAWRRCGPGRAERRRVFIAPYPKGPVDKELVIKDEVRVWDR